MDEFAKTVAGTEGIPGVRFVAAIRHVARNIPGLCADGALRGPGDVIKLLVSGARNRWLSTFGWPGRTLRRPVGTRRARFSRRWRTAIPLIRTAARTNRRQARQQGRDEPLQLRVNFLEPL